MRATLAVAAGAAVLLLAASCGGATSAAPRKPGAPALAVTLHERDALALLDADARVVARVAVGPAPWGVAVAGGRAYVATARGVAVVDLRRRRVVGRVRYRTRLGRPERGEYRAGGMGIAADAAAGRVYVGVHPDGGGPGRLEVLDTRSGRMVGSVPIGERPFDVLVSRDGRDIYTIDHDSYGITAVDAAALSARTISVAPLGRGAFDKLNYGGLDRRGRLLLPINGQVLAVVDPRTGTLRTRPLRARVHQAGAATSRGRLLTVGAESLGEGGGPSLSVYDIRSGRERLIRLRRPHEEVAVSSDGRTAYLTGGYTRGGWNGITIVRLDSAQTREVRLAGQPLGIARVPAR